MKSELVVKDTTAARRVAPSHYRHAITRGSTFRIAEKFVEMFEDMKKMGMGMVVSE